MAIHQRKGFKMRETLSLFMWHHWQKSFWNGHYFWLIQHWGVKYVYLDTYRHAERSIKIKTGARLAIDPTYNECSPDVYLWSWQKMPTGYRWF